MIELSWKVVAMVALILGFALSLIQKDSGSFFIGFGYYVTSAP